MRRVHRAGCSVGIQADGRYIIQAQKGKVGEIILCQGLVGQMRMNAAQPLSRPGPVDNPV